MTNDNSETKDEEKTVDEEIEISTPDNKKKKDTVITLFDKTEVTEQRKDDRELRDIPLEDIRVSKLNVRLTDPLKDVEILAQDMRRHGLRQPIEVRRAKVSGNKELFDVVAGSRRTAAARMIGWKTIRAFILSDTLPEDDRLLSLSENINRVDIDPKDRAMAVLELLEAYDNDWVLLSEVLNRSITTLQYWTNYCKVPEKIQVMVTGDKIGSGYARKLARYSEVEPEEMVKIAEKISTIPYQDKKRKDAIIEAIKEAPKITVKEIEEKLEEQEQDLAISIIFKARVAKIIKKEGERRFEEPTQFIKSVIREYLEQRGLLKQKEEKTKDDKKRFIEQPQSELPSKEEKEEEGIHTEMQEKPSEISDAGIIDDQSETQMI
ncbi:MAG: ParB/RepB/Spo0J family partition protein [Acidobacteriia bacterium]|nr:ParB/RepB/Spo0J family partition protein [Terriglobia bacterium]